MHHPTDRITHTTAFVAPVVEHWLEREIAHEGSIWRPIAPWANALPLSYVPLPIIIRLPLVNPILSLYCIILHAPHMLMVNGLNCNNILGVVPQSDLSSTIIVSRCYNDLNFFLRLTACSTKRHYSHHRLRLKTYNR